MTTDRKVSLAWVMLDQGQSVATVARRLRMGEKTIRKYRDADKLPSQFPKKLRNYRTRKDPLADYWPEVEALLTQDSNLKPVTLLEWLKQKHNQAGGEVAVGDSVRRTLERRIARWRLDHDVLREVIFPQVHHAGDVIAFDFVAMNALRLTIAGRPFDHLLFHAVLTYSNWESVHLCHSESFEALSVGLQDALHRAGGVPRRVRSDSLSAAVNNLSSDKAFAAQYRALLAHYGVQGHRINVRKPQENGDVESAHGHLKTAVDQALRLRGSRDFGSVPEYVAFVEQVVAGRNAPRNAAFREEVAALGPLPARRLNSFTAVSLTVKEDCIVRVKHNAYSVSSKYIGLEVEVQIHQDHLELWYRNECLERMPRLFGNGKEAIDFRHVIDSLVRKPGAFVNYKYVNHLYPTTRFRMAYDQLVQRMGEADAVKQYLKILYAAKYEGLDRVDDVLRWFLNEGKPITAADVEASAKCPPPIPGPTDVQVEPPSLETFDSLLQHKEVYHEPEVEMFPSSHGHDEDRGGLEDYDRYVQIAGAAQGVEVTDVPGGPPHGGRASGAGGLDAHAVLVGLGPAGMPVATAEPHRPPAEKLASADRQELGAVRLAPSSAACHAAVRDASPRRLPRSPGQPAGLREARLRQIASPLCLGRPTGATGPVGVLLDLSDVGPGVVAREARPALGTGDPETPQVRGVDHRRPGLCAAEPRGDGSVVHAVGPALRAGQRSAEFEPGVLQLGADLQGPHDHGRGHRPVDPPLGHHRTQHSQLSTGSGQTGQETANRIRRVSDWFNTLTLRQTISTDVLIVAKGLN
jgi:Mu transposase-like protein